MFLINPFFTYSGTSQINELSNLGLLTNLKLSLDFADQNCYPGTGQSITDLLGVVSPGSGVTSPFNRGSGSGSDAADPTFNGTAGNLTKNEYFSCDGGDYFSYSLGTNEAWMKSLFKPGSNSFFAVVRIASDVVTPIFATETSGTPSAYGGSIKYDATNNKFAYVHPNTGGGAYGVFLFGPDISASLPGDFAVGLSTTIDGSGNYTITAIVNGTEDSYSGSGTVPASNDPTAIAKIMATGNAAEKAPSGSRLYELAVWQGTALSLANLRSLYAQRRNRYGI